eukprot:259211-Chlamydomonas_euryale.AAC.1
MLLRRDAARVDRRGAAAGGATPQPALLPTGRAARQVVDAGRADAAAARTRRGRVPAPAGAAYAIGGPAGVRARCARRGHGRAGAGALGGCCVPLPVAAAAGTGRQGGR